MASKYRKVNDDLFFAHENHTFPPTLSKNSEMYFTVTKLYGKWYGLNLVDNLPGKYVY